MTARPDFASRALAVDLPQIKDERRQEESVFWGEFDRAQPIILGGILSAVVAILAIRNEVKLPASPGWLTLRASGLRPNRCSGGRMDRSLPRIKRARRTRRP
jgi:hypothetical protein